ncbi:hypothetical protein EV356DRAFT_579261 [Viridothelium virens]|uniref:J domain-containing protein n=1 Tax=Viridothelium virens TaxID=1048519 RepID=A0A6A6GZP1_VIRVR|nr:hypothetical protein EV356DRAFT_579261 [Viridothelium virens]
MDSPPPLELPPDPYATLGVPQDASVANIKTVYRKLILKHHPDKVQDEAKKKEASDQFSKIQHAYELLCDDEERKRYDASVRLMQSRREAMEARQERAASLHQRDGSHVGNSMPRTATAAYDFKTSSGARGATFEAKGPTRYTEERRPRYAEYDEYAYPEVRVPSSKYDDYYSKSKSKISPRSGRDSEPEPVRISRKESEKSSRSEKTKASDRERRKDRDVKFQYVEPEGVDPYDNSYGMGGKTRGWGESDRERAKDETRRQKARGDHDPGYEYERHYKERDLEDRAREYQRQAKSHSVEPERPPASRSASAKDASYLRRSSTDTRPSIARRSSARKADPSPSRRGKKDSDRKYSMPEIVEEPKRPIFATSYTTPNLESMVNEPAHPGQTYTTATTYPQEPVQPGMRRAETMSAYPTISSRTRRDGGAPQSNKVKETHHDSGYSSPSSAEGDPYGTTSQYTQSGYFRPNVVDEHYEVTNGRRTQRMEPTSAHRKRSLSPREHRPRPSSRRQSDAPATPTYKFTHYQYPSIPSSTTVEPPTSSPPSTHPSEVPRDRPTLPRGKTYHGSSSQQSTMFGENGAGTIPPTATEHRQPAPTTSGEHYRSTTSAAAAATASHTDTREHGKSSTKKTAGMMADLAEKAHPHTRTHGHTSYTKTPKMEDIRLSNPMGSKAPRTATSGSGRRRVSSAATGSRGGYFRRGEVAY